MAKVTSKLQVTIPKAIAERHRIRPGDRVEFVSAGDVVRIEPVGQRRTLSVKERLELFDEATRRLRRRRWNGPEPADRGWKREDLYDRGFPR
jgi:AbrB family looped-hinge helix DNA binding protein